MTKVIGVRFRTAGKVYFFDPGDKDINEARRVIAASEPIAHYAPQDGEVWEEAYKTYLKVTGQEA